MAITIVAVFLTVLAAAHAQLTNNSLPLLVPEVYNGSEDTVQAKFDFYPNYTTLQVGTPNTTEAKLYLVNTTNGRNFSSWTDVSLGLNESAPGEWTTWALIEIPVNTTAKIETKTGSPSNPLVQDRKKDTADDGTKTETLRFYKYKPSLVNYGGFPQTWEDSEIPDNKTGLVGDNDPVDLLEIGSVVAPMGSIIRVKILGALGLIDDNETDWKIVVISTKDPNASRYQDISDVPKPLRDNLYDFFLNYKKPEGKPPTHFFPDNVTDSDLLFLNKTTAVEILKERHAAYQRLLSGQCKTERCLDLSYPGAPPKEKKDKEGNGGKGKDKAGKESKDDPQDIEPATGRRLKSL